MEKLRLNINGIEVSGYKGQTILEVAGENGIEIPTFCYDGRMDIFGSCGICVVEAEGNPKLLRSCATEIADGMIIRTDTKRVYQSRKANLELLLSQHTGDCRAPCHAACPALTDCQGYVGLIANGEVEEAYKLIISNVPLAASIGRVCPHPCEEKCRRGLVEEPVSICNLKRFAADSNLRKAEPYLPAAAPPTGKKAAIIGGGPGGLSCAFFLAEMGHSVTVYDAMPKMGGMLRYGIPEYRLPKSVVDTEAAQIQKMGVEYRNNVKIGRDISFDSVKASYDAVVIAAGAWVSTPLPCPGSSLQGVYGGIEFLKKVYSNETVSVGKSVAVVGGGNTAMDACRTAVRLGAQEVYIIYRRTKAEMPADEVEIREAEEEGVIFKYLVNPIEIIEDSGKAAKLRLQKMRLGDADESGRRRPEPVAGDEEMLEVDTVIAALGQGVMPDGFPDVALTRGNTVAADESSFATNVQGVFAVGDCINDGAAIAIKAIGDAKRASAAVDRFLRGENITYKAPYRVSRDDLTAADFADRKKEPRANPDHLSPDDRADNFLQIMETFSEDAAIKEASRCLECGCADFFECKLIAQADKYDVDPLRFSGSTNKVKLNDNHPFIVRDPNKCILCGLCARMCDEVIGSSAIGFVDRGFNASVKPAFGDDLSGTTCISCGSCVSVCPTGALQERQSFKKSVPLDTNKTDSICGICSIGCKTRVESIGNTLVKTTPAAAGADGTGGIMCGRGRFGAGFLQRDGRITTPMIRINGKLESVSLREAAVYTAKKMESLRLRGEKIAVSIGQTYCAEDAGAIKDLAALFGAPVFSFANRENGLAKVFGYDGSPNTAEELSGTDEVFVFGEAPLYSPAILARLRRAVKNGTRVTVVCPQGSGKVYNLRCNVIKAPQTTAFIRQIIKSLIEAGCVPESADGFKELKAALAAIEVSPEAETFAKSYMAAKKAMILFTLYELSSTAAAEIANLAVVAGHIGRPRDGIILQRQMSGSQVLADLGITAEADAAAGAKGLMVFGEDTEIESADLGFLMVQDTHFTPLAEKADVVFPRAAYTEMEGTFVNTGRRLQRTSRIVEPPFPCTTADIASAIAEILEEKIVTGTVRDGLYRGIKDGEFCTEPVLFTNGFRTDNGKAKLQTLSEAVLYEELPQTCSLMKAVEEQIADSR